MVRSYVGTGMLMELMGTRTACSPRRVDAPWSFLVLRLRFSHVLLFRHGRSGHLLADCISQPHSQQ